MNDKVKEVYNSLQERFKSPFLLTFIMVWAIKHWRLILIVLNFKHSESADSKQTQIEHYINDHSLTIYKWELPNWAGMVLPVLFWSLVSIICYYAITITTESITIWYKRVKSRVMLFLNEHRAIVTKQEYDNEVSKASRLQIRNETLTKRMGELQTQNDLEKKVVDASVEGLRKELLNLTGEHEALKLSNESLTASSEIKDEEIEKLKSAYSPYNDEIKIYEHKLKVAERRIVSRNSKILQLLSDINNAINLNDLKKVVESENLVDIDQNINEESTSDILKSIFGGSTWLFTANYPNGSDIKERFKLVGTKFILQDGQRIEISNVSFDRSNNKLKLYKSNKFAEPPYKDLENNLDVRSPSEFMGLEGTDTLVSYKRI